MIGSSLAHFAPREGGASDEIVGVRPEQVFTPRSCEDAARLMGETAAQGLRLAFVGGATQLGLGRPPEKLDAVIRTELLCKIIEYAPSDQIVVAEAGITLSALQRALGEFGQRLAIDPPWPERATLGGIVAGNAFGPLRTRYGSIRDLIIGVSFVRADGVSARGGGKVVKNVAGFDLPKLMVGSLGTLGLMTTVTFRLHPLPQTAVTMLLRGQTPAQVRALLVAIRAAQLEPAAFAAMTDRTSSDVAVRFEGFQAGVDEQRDRLISLVSPEGACSALDDAAARKVWAQHDQVRTSGTLRAKLAAPPSAIEIVLQEALAPLLQVLDGSGLVFYPMIGLGFVSGAAVAAERAAQAIASARRVLHRLGGSLVLEAAPPEIRATCDVWGQDSRAPSLTQSIKTRLDPERRLSPGRFVGGI